MITYGATEMVVYEIKDYSFKEIEEIGDIIINSGKDKVSHRTKKSYVTEMKIHKILYHLGISRVHTKDVNLQYDIPLWEHVIYKIVGLLL